MATEVSIPERIIRVIRENVQGISGIGKVKRSDDRGTDLGNQDAVIGSGVMRPQAERSGNPTHIQERFAVEIAMRLLQPENVSESTDELVLRWVHRIVDAVMADRNLVESGGNQDALAIDVSLVRASPLRPTQPGETNSLAFARFDVIFMHQADDLANGPGITKLTE